MTVRLNTLGRLQVFRGAEELASYSGRGTRCALLLYVALEGETTRDAAVATLWPDSSPERARHSLSQTLYELRRDLGEEWVDASGEMLRPGDLESDVQRFTEAVGAERYGDALSLFHGPFLDGVYLVESSEFQSWVDRRRSSIERLRRKAQRSEVERRLERGDLDGALSMTHSWVDHDPLDDEAQHALIRLLAEAGRRAEALAQFERFERTLRQELEVEPLEETCRLVEQIRAGTDDPNGPSLSGGLLAGLASSPGAKPGGQDPTGDEAGAERGVRAQLEASLAGEFDIVRKIGQGSSAEIYLARELNLRRLVAIKVLRAEIARMGTQARRFFREAQAAARISDPNVASVFRSGVLENELPYLVMEWIKGTSLADQIASSGRVGVARVRAILTGIARGLAAAHAKGIVHRDVRPGNVLIEEETGRITLTDFGIAAVLATGAETPEVLTQRGEVLSQPRYAAPEQTTGDGVSERSDIYSLGVIAFEMLTGEHPYGDKSAAQLALATMREEPRRVLDVAPDVEPSLADLVDRCLTRKVDRRPSAAQVVAELTGEGSPPAGEAEPPTTHFWAEARERRVPWVAAVFAAASWALLSASRAWVEADVIGAATHSVILISLVCAFHAALIGAWFHGKAGRQARSPVEAWLLGGVAFVWVALSLLVLVT